MKRSNLTKIVLVAFALGLVSAPVRADSPACLISFEGAGVDVCENRVWLANEDLRHLADPRRYADADVRLVKFDGPITAAQHTALVGLGAEILGYVPFHSYKVRMPAMLDSAVRGIGGVTWTGPYLPALKIGVNVANELHDGRILDTADHIDALWVSLHRGVPADRFRDVLAVRQHEFPGASFRADGIQGRDREFVLLDFERVQLAALVEALAAEALVDFVDFHWPNEPMNAEGTWLHQSGVNTPSPQRPIFDQGLFGCGQIVGVLDTGLHVAHCSFEDTDYGPPVADTCNDGPGCGTIVPDFDHRKVGAYYKWFGTGAPGDSHGHGTFVSGNLTGNNHADLVDCENLTTPGGLSNVDGMAPGAKMVMQEAGATLQYLNALGGSLYHAATVAYDTDVRIHNNSWGSACRNQAGQCIAGCQVGYRANSRGGDEAAWEHPDLLIFAAAGNSGTGCGPGADVGSPGNAKNVFGIGGTQRGTLGNNMYTSSSRGPASDRRTKPDVLAQSQSVFSSIPSACGNTSSSGTSFGSPTAAGLGALVREYLQRGFYPLGVEEPAFAIPDPPGVLIKAIMINGSVEITGTGTNPPAPNQAQGWGRVLLDNSLYFDGDDRRLWFHHDTGGLQTGQVDTHSIAVAAGEPLTVTLVWHDYPAELEAMPHIVNMLRLEVETPGGQVWTQKLPPGGGLTNANPFQDTTFTDYDDLNTVHQIRLDAPAAGDYEIRVNAIQVALGGAQPYALVATGDLLGVVEPGFLLQSTPPAMAVCQGDDAVFDIGVLSIEEFDDPVDLGLTDGLPPGASEVFSVNPIVPATPAAVSVLTISGGAPGDYVLEITGESDGPGFDPLTRSVELGLRIDTPLAAPALVAPPNGAQGVGPQPEFLWDALAGAAQYRIQVATDGGFGTPLIDQVVDGTAFVPDNELDADTDYFWRVQALNACDGGDWSAVFEFRTGDVPVADISPAFFEFEVEAGGTGEDVLNIGNTGGADLTWSITQAEPEARGGPIDDDWDEGFEDISLLPAQGWAMQNNSQPLGTTGWVQGGTPFDAHQGPSDSYIAANFNNGAAGGMISNWLLTPEIVLRNGTELRFWTRHSTTTTFPDRMQVRLSVAGASTDVGTTATSVGDFDTLLLDINEAMVYPGYPEVWTEFVITLEDLAAPASGRFGFRYYSPDWETVGSFIGIDTLSVIQPEGPCDNPVNIPWLAADPDSGTTPPDSSVPVDVTVDAGDLAEGDYQALLCVATDDPAAPLVEVPVSVSVIEPVIVPGILAVDPDALAFGDVDEGGSSVLAITVSNVAAEGAADLELEQIDVVSGAPVFSVAGGDCGATLAAQTSCAVEVQFSPDALGAFSGLLRIAAEGKPAVDVSLTGQGVEPVPTVFSDRFEFSEE